MEDRHKMADDSRPEADMSLGSTSASARPPLRPDERKVRAVVVFSLVVVLAGIAFLPLGSHVVSLGWQTCAFRGATGLPCPLCGGTRAAQALLHGDFARAFYLNMAVFPGLVVLAVGAIVLAAEALHGRAIIPRGVAFRSLRSLLPALALLFLLYWIAHLVGAVRTVKPELVDLRHPIARFICQRFSDASK